MHAGDKRRSGAAAGNDRRPRFGSAEVQTRVGAGDDIERPAGGKFDDGRQGEIAYEMFPGAVADLAGSGLENSTGDPAMALVIDGICFFQIREAAVLRFESGLQVSTVIDGVRPGVAGEEFEGPV